MQFAHQQTETDLNKHCHDHTGCAQQKAKDVIAERLLYEFAML